MNNLDFKGLSIQGFDFEVKFRIEPPDFPLKFHPKRGLAVHKIEVYFHQSSNGISMFLDFRNSRISHVVRTTCNTSHFSAANNTCNHNDMPQATNVLLYDDSSQSAMLGDACLIAVLSSLTMMLRLVDIVVKKQSKRKRRNKIYQRIQRNRRTIQSLYDQYGILFTSAYRMNYETFKVLHDLLKPGIDEYISNNNN